MANIKFKTGTLDRLTNLSTAPTKVEGTLYFADNEANVPGTGRIYYDTKDSNNNDVRIVVGAGDGLVTAGATQIGNEQTLYLIGSQSSNAETAKTYSSRISVVGTTITATLNGNASTATIAGKVNHALTFGSKTFDGSTAQTLTLADLAGLTANNIIRTNNNGELAACAEIATSGDNTQFLRNDGTWAAPFDLSIVNGELCITYTTA